MYLMDSIIKNVKGGPYLQLFSQNIVSIFCGVFEKVDEKVRSSLFKLRSTWNDYFTQKKLFALDTKVKELDPAWPVMATAPESPSIHINPKFIKKTSSAPESSSAPTKKEAREIDLEQKEKEMRKSLLAKQQELMEIHKKRLELELLQTKAKLQEQSALLERKNMEMQRQKQPQVLQQPMIPMMPFNIPQFPGQPFPGYPPGWTGPIPMQMQMYQLPLQAQTGIPGAPMMPPNVSTGQPPVTQTKPDQGTTASGLQTQSSGTTQAPPNAAARRDPRVQSRDPRIRKAAVDAQAQQAPKTEEGTSTATPSNQVPKKVNLPSDAKVTDLKNKQKQSTSAAVKTPKETSASSPKKKVVKEQVSNSGKVNSKTKQIGQVTASKKEEHMKPGDPHKQSNESFKVLSSKAPPSNDAKKPVIDLAKTKEEQSREKSDVAKKKEEHCKEKTDITKNEEQNKDKPETKRSTETNKTKPQAHGKGKNDSEGEKHDSSREGSKSPRGGGEGSRSPRGGGKLTSKTEDKKRESSSVPQKKSHRTSSKTHSPSRSRSRSPASKKFKHAKSRRRISEEETRRDRDKGRDRREGKELEKDKSSVERDKRSQRKEDSIRDGKKEEDRGDSMKRKSPPRDPRRLAAPLKEKARYENFDEQQAKRARIQGNPRGFEERKPPGEWGQPRREFDHQVDTMDERNSLRRPLLSPARMMMSPPIRQQFRRRPSIDPTVSIPKELSVEKMAAVMEQADKRLRSGELSHEEHQKLLRELNEVYKFQKEKEYDPFPALYRRGEVGVRGMGGLPRRDRSGFRYQIGGGLIRSPHGGPIDPHRFPSDPRQDLDIPHRDNEDPLALNIARKIAYQKRFEGPRTLHEGIPNRDRRSLELAGSKDVDLRVNNSRYGERKDSDDTQTADKLNPKMDRGEKRRVSNAGDFDTDPVSDLDEKESDLEEVAKTKRTITKSDNSNNNSTKEKVEKKDSSEKKSPKSTEGKIQESNQQDSSSAKESEEEKTMKSKGSEIDDKPEGEKKVVEKTAGKDAVKKEEDTAGGKTEHEGTKDASKEKKPAAENRKEIKMVEAGDDESGTDSTTDAVRKEEDKVTKKEMPASDTAIPLPVVDETKKDETGDLDVQMGDVDERKLLTDEKPQKKEDFDETVLPAAFRDSVDPDLVAQEALADQDMRDRGKLMHPLAEARPRNWGDVPTNFFNEEGHHVVTEEGGVLKEKAALGGEGEKDVDMRNKSLLPSAERSQKMALEGYRIPRRAPENPSKKEIPSLFSKEITKEAEAAKRRFDRALREREESRGVVTERHRAKDPRLLEAMHRRDLGGHDPRRSRSGRDMRRPPPNERDLRERRDWDLDRPPRFHRLRGPRRDSPPHSPHGSPHHFPEHMEQRYPEPAPGRFDVPYEIGMHGADPPFQEEIPYEPQFTGPDPGVPYVPMDRNMLRNPEAEVLERFPPPLLTHPDMLGPMEPDPPIPQAMMQEGPGPQFMLLNEKDLESLPHHPGMQEPVIIRIPLGVDPNSLQLPGPGMIPHGADVHGRMPFMEVPHQPPDIQGFPSHMMPVNPTDVRFQQPQLMHPDQMRPGLHSDQILPGPHLDQMQPGLHPEHIQPGFHLDQVHPTMHHSLLPQGTHVDPSSGQVNSHFVSNQPQMHQGEPEHSFNPNNPPVSNSALSLPSSLQRLLGLQGGQSATPPPQEPGSSQVDVNNLFNKLMSFGIINQPSDSPKADGTCTPPPDKTKSAERQELKRKDNGEGNTEEETPVLKKPRLAQPEELSMKQFQLMIPLLTFKPEDLKKRYAGVVHSLISGTQCSSCGVRFTLDDMESYRKHLDWHFRQNRKERDGAKAATSRKWYYDLNEWLLYEEIDETEEGGRSTFFDHQQALNQDIAMQVQQGSHVPVSGNADDEFCKICHEAFEQYWDEEEEEWHLKDAIKVNSKTYHPACFEDLQNSSIIGDSTSSFHEFVEKLTEKGQSMEEGIPGLLSPGEHGNQGLPASEDNSAGNQNQTTRTNENEKMQLNDSKLLLVPKLEPGAEEMPKESEVESPAPEVESLAPEVESPAPEDDKQKRVHEEARDSTLPGVQVKKETDINMLPQKGNPTCEIKTLVGETEHEVKSEEGQKSNNTVSPSGSQSVVIKSESAEDRPTDNLKETQESVVKTEPFDSISVVRQDSQAVVVKVEPADSMNDDGCKSVSTTLQGDCATKERSDSVNDDSNTMEVKSSSDNQVVRTVSDQEEGTKSEASFSKEPKLSLGDGSDSGVEAGSEPTEMTSELSAIKINVQEESVPDSGKETAAADVPGSQSSGISSLSASSTQTASVSQSVNSERGSLEPEAESKDGTIKETVGNLENPSELEASGDKNIKDVGQS